MGLLQTILLNHWKVRLRILLWWKAARNDLINLSKKSNKSKLFFFLWFEFIFTTDNITNFISCYIFLKFSGLFFWWGAGGAIHILIILIHRIHPGILDQNINMLKISIMNILIWIISRIDLLFYLWSSQVSKLFSCIANLYFIWFS